jgi:hypothetical protein
MQLFDLIGRCDQNEIASQPGIDSLTRGAGSAEQAAHQHVGVEDDANGHALGQALIGEILTAFFNESIQLRLIDVLRPPPDIDEDLFQRGIAARKELGEVKNFLLSFGG